MYILAEVWTLALSIKIHVSLEGNSLYKKKSQKFYNSEMWYKLKSTMYFVVKVIDFGFWFKLLVAYDSNIRDIVVKVTNFTTSSHLSLETNKSYKLTCRKINLNI